MSFRVWAPRAARVVFRSTGGTANGRDGGGVPDLDATGALRLLLASAAGVEVEGVGVHLPADAVAVFERMPGSLHAPGGDR